MAQPSSRSQKDIPRFEHEQAADARRSLMFGTTNGSVFLPIKVVDDGSGLGKVVTEVE